MATPPDPAVLTELGRIVELVLDASNDPENEAMRWITEFKTTHPPVVWLTLLLHYFSTSDVPERCRAIAAILLHSALHKRSPDAQRHFLQSYLKFDIKIRDQLRQSAIQHLTSAHSEDLAVQCANLLGLFFAMEHVTRLPLISSMRLLRLQSCINCSNTSHCTLLSFGRTARVTKFSTISLRVCSKFFLRACEIRRCLTRN
jgi:hypothetical protein